MKEQILYLRELQSFDSEIKRLTARKKDLPAEKERLKEELERFEKTVEDSRTRMDELQKLHRDREKELKVGLDNVKKAKSRLLEVKTNKEYEAMLKEIDGLNQKNSALEDEILNLLEQVEKAGGESRRLENELTEVRDRGEKEIAAVDTEMKSIDIGLEEAVLKEKEARARIEPDVLRRYDIISERRNGQAVVSVWKEVCSGCHMNIPPQMYNELRTYEHLYLCPSCNRIIYWEDRDNGA